jgi:hypothetical protein
MDLRLAAHQLENRKGGGVFRSHMGRCCGSSLEMLAGEWLASRGMAHFLRFLRSLDSKNYEINIG